MRIAITGGSGRIGRAVVALALQGGHQVVSIDHVPPTEEAFVPNATYITADTSDYDAFAAALSGCDAVIHLAAIPGPRRDPDHVVHNTNVTSSYNALRAAAEHGITRVCQASSINAVGGVFSREPRFDYFPLDERHPTYNEDPYSLSKWICEAQGDSFARRYEGMTIASLRFHGVRPAKLPDIPADNPWVIRDLWGYTLLHKAAEACMLGITAPFTGHEVFYIVAPDTQVDVPTMELRERFYPQVPVRGDLGGTRSLFDTSKAERLLGWTHE